MIDMLYTFQRAINTIPEVFQLSGSLSGAAGCNAAFMFRNLGFSLEGSSSEAAYSNWVASCMSSV